MVLNIAHRGARSLAPENTLLAASKGIEAGADMWETDVRVTADGHLALFHDHRLTRTTDVVERFPDRSDHPFTTFTLEEIRSLDAGSWFLDADPFGQIAAGVLSTADQSECRGQKIPTLEEALHFTGDSGWRINLELKRLSGPVERFPLVEKVLMTIDRVGIPVDRVVVSSFEHAWLDECRRRRPKLEVQALIGYHSDRPLDWGDLRFRTYNVNSDLLGPDGVREKVRCGFAINLWTVNEAEDMKRFSDAGAAGIITDFPQWLARLSESGFQT
ncbi:MAG: glycerophosphodiester phosphodiesterase [Desulfobacterales bacterium]